MFDFRYHVASLAAVFFALVIGILVGVALASHGLGNTERKRLEEDLRRAEGQADVLRTQVEGLKSDSAADRAFVEGTYKSVMAGRLKGKKIAVLFVGSSESVRRSAIANALADGCAGEEAGEQALARKLRRTGSVEEPGPRPRAGVRGGDGHAVVECIAERPR